MGLDMYLQTNSQALTRFLESRGLLDPVFEGSRRRGVIGYWRKANAIHKWMEENLSEPVENCRSSLVTVKDLRNLKCACDDVLENSQTKESNECFCGYFFEDGKQVRVNRKGRLITNPELAKSILPTCEGFFFGDTEYDDLYLDSLDYTSKLLGAILPYLSNSGEYFSDDYHLWREERWVVEFRYTASW